METLRLSAEPLPIVRTGVHGFARELMSWRASEGPRPLGPGVERLPTLEVPGRKDPIGTPMQPQRKGEGREDGRPLKGAFWALEWRWNCHRGNTNLLSLT